MSKPKLFVGSSQTNYRVAELIAEKLEECAEVTTWKEGVFGLNLGFLETLLKRLEDFDFAVFILAPDDMTTSKDETKPSPRDNVLFESGLFMGVLGRDRVFLVFDEKAGVKIPTDLLGVTLAAYDGTRIGGDDAAAAVRGACRLISDRVTASKFSFLVGEWQSSYNVSVLEGAPLADEVVEVKPFRDGLSITSKKNDRDDYYQALGQIVCERQLIGRWKSRPDKSNTEGSFILTIAANSKVMYGYWTAPDTEDRITYGTWVLAKKDGTDDETVKERLKWGHDLLRRMTIGLSANDPDH